MKVKSGNLDPQEVRFSLLFWDRLVWPTSRAVHFSSSPDETFLERAGILKRPEYTVFGDIAQGLVQSQIQAFLERDQLEPGLWSISQGETSLLLKDGFIQEGNGAFVELHRAIPVPDKDVPLDDILEFRRRRYDELLLLRDKMDNFVAAINVSSDREIDIAKHAAKIDLACADALRIGKEWRLPMRLSNVKMSIDLRPFNTVAAAMVAWQAGKDFGMPLSSAIIAGASASIKFGADFGMQRVRPRQGPYRYVSRFHQEVF